MLKSPCRLQKNNNHLPSPSNHPLGGRPGRLRPTIHEFSIVLCQFLDQMPSTIAHTQTQQAPRKLRPHRANHPFKLLTHTGNDLVEAFDEDWAIRNNHSRALSKCLALSRFGSQLRLEPQATTSNTLEPHKGDPTRAHIANFLREKTRPPPIKFAALGSLKMHHALRIPPQPFDLI